MKQQPKKQSGLSLIEILIAVTLAAILIAGMQGLISLALNAESSTRARNDSLQQGRFAMQMMVKSVRMTRRLMIPLGENPNTVYSESERDVLAVTLDPTLDRDKDGWADANNDKDYLDINGDSVRDAGEPELIDEDLPSDATNDAQDGIIGIDDDNDGLIDESSPNDDDEDGVPFEDKYNGLDDDGDGSIDEDSHADMNQDGAAGTGGTCNNKDDDEDGIRDEDWLDPVVYFLNGTTLIQRIPNINPVDGTDYQENPIAENVTIFQVTRFPQGDGRAVLVKITLEIGELDSFKTSVGVGSGL
jgi:prepilin-type N-terminal cleavage/methylation domain-containing protein